MQIPIVFSFNNNYTIPAGVTLTSLLANAQEKTFFIINILYNSTRLTPNNIDTIKSLEKYYNNCEIYFIDIKNSFNNTYETRGVTIESYYRLLVPILFNQYKKVIYSDVDVVFSKDISELYQINMKENYIAGVKEYPQSCPSSMKKYLKRINLDCTNYINAGILIFNNDKINQSKEYQLKISQLVNKKFKYQDQDILNIVFSNKIYYLPATYNYNIHRSLQGNDIQHPHIYHYTLQKPWNQPKAFGHHWWYHYQNSIFYDEKFYFSFIKKNYQYFDILMNLGKKLEKINFFKVYILLHRLFSKS